MAKMRFSMRKRPSVGYIITGVSTLFLYLLVGNKVLAAVVTTIGNISGTPFEDAFEFLGMDSTDGTGWASTTIVGILGLAAVASFVLAFVKISLR